VRNSRASSAAKHDRLKLMDGILGRVQVHT